MRSTSISSTSLEKLKLVHGILRCHESPRITAVGPASRTWFVDRYLLQRALLRLSTTPVQVVSGGKFPFDLMLEEACDLLGVDWVPGYRKSRKARLTPDYRRPTTVWLDTQLVLVFPDTTRDLESADPFLECVDIPMLIIPREGEWLLSGI